VTTDAGVSVKVIAGSAQGTAGAMTREGTQPVYLDVHMPAGARFDESQGSKPYEVVTASTEMRQQGKGWCHSG